MVRYRRLMGEEGAMSQPPEESWARIRQRLNDPDDSLLLEYTVVALDVYPDSELPGLLQETPDRNGLLRTLWTMTEQSYGRSQGRVRSFREWRASDAGELVDDIIRVYQAGGKARERLIDLAAVPA